MPMPEKFLSNSPPRHERVLSLTVLPFTAKLPEGGPGSKSEVNHTRTVVVDLVCGEGASLRVGDEDAKLAAGEIVANNLRVRPLRVSKENTHDLVTARNVGEDLRTGRVDDGEAVDPVAYGIIPRDSGIRALVNVDPEDIASDDIVHDLGARTGLDNDAMFGGFRAAYNMVLRDSGVDTLAKGDPASDIACDTVSHNSSVASGVNVDHERRVVPLPFNLEAPDREPRNAHIAHALPGELAGLEIEVAPDANSLRSETPRAGRVRFGFGGS